MIELKMIVDDVDYEGALEVLLPIITAHLEKNAGNAFLAGILSKTKGLPVAAASAALKVLPQSTRDELAVMCLNHYKEKIISMLTEASEKQGISLKVHDMEIKNMEG